MKNKRSISQYSLLLVGCVFGLGGGGVAWIAGRHGLASAAWAGTAGLAAWAVYR